MLQYWMQALGMAPPRRKRQASADLVERILRDATHGTTPPATPLAQQPQAYSTLQAPQTHVASHPHPDAADMGNENAPSEAAPQASPALPPPAEPPASSAAAAAAVDTPASDGDAAAAAAAALQSLESGHHHADAAKRAGMVRVVEKRNFAGREVEMEREVQAGSKAAQVAQDRAAAASNKSGLDAALANITGVPAAVPNTACSARPWYCESWGMTNTPVVAACAWLLLR